MSKELENLLEDLDSCEEVKTRYGLCYAYSPDIVEKLKKAILELKAIKESDPNRTLKCLERINKEYLTIESEDFDNCFNTIKQALLKAQEQDKVLEIIKEKNVNLEVLGISNNVNCYNKVIERYSVCYKELTEEEFNLLKRYFK